MRAGICHWHLHGFGIFAVVKTRRPPTGRVGLINHTNWLDVDLAWHLFAGAEGHGLAIEAAMAVKTWDCEVLGMDSLHSQIDRGTARSQAVAKRFGAVTDATRASQHAGTDGLRPGSGNCWQMLIKC